MRSVRFGVEIESEKPGASDVAPARERVWQAYPKRPRIGQSSRTISAALIELPCRLLRT
jgi:hypothetical protein